MRHNNTTRALNGLHDKRRNRVGTLKVDLVFHRLCNELRQNSRVRLIKRIAVGIGARQMETARQKRLISNAEAIVPVHTRAAKMRTVIALLEAEELGARRFPFDAVILPRQSQACLHRVRAARCKENAPHPVGLKELAHGIRRLDCCGVGCARKGRIVRQLVKLFGNRVFHHIVGVAKVHTPKPAHSVHNFRSVQISDLHTVRTFDNRRRMLKAVARRTHRMPHMACIVLFEEVVVFHRALHRAIKTGLYKNLIKSSMPPDSVQRDYVL